MPVLKLKIDLCGTIGDEAWKRIAQHEEAQAAFFGPEFGTSGPCHHVPGAMHSVGEWRGAEILLETRTVAEDALSHYQHQPGVLNAEIAD